MKLRILITFAFAIFQALLSLQAKEKHMWTTVLKGEVAERPYSNTLLLLKEGDDPRVNTLAEIPIEEGRFEYVLQYGDNEAYELIFKDEYDNGTWMSATFFPDGDTVFLKLYPQDKADMNSAEGGEANAQMNHAKKLKSELFDFRSLEAEVERLQKENVYMLPEMTVLQNRIENSRDQTEKDSLLAYWFELYKSGDHLTPEAKELDKKWEDMFNDYMVWEAQNAVDKPSIYNYSRMVRNMGSGLYERLPPQVGIIYQTAFNEQYAKLFPDHSYTEKMSNRLRTLDLVRIGGRYIDFSLPDLEGNPVKLSDRIDGSISLINMWASWCGPCLRLNAEMIPVYEEFRGKGFTIVGIAREKDVENAKIAAKRGNYPWLNLIELNDAEQIWARYGIDRAGGSTFLVDSQGTIIAVHPSAKELREILATMLD